MDNLDQAKQAIISYRDNVKLKEHGDISPIFTVETLQSQLYDLGYENIEQVFVDLETNTLPTCKRCGNCCNVKYGQTIITANKADSTKYYLTHNCTVQDRPDNALYVIYSFPCNFLSYDKEGLAICANPGKPNICVNYFCDNALYGLN